MGTFSHPGVKTIIYFVSLDSEIGCCKSSSRRSKNTNYISWVSPSPMWSKLGIEISFCFHQINNWELSVSQHPLLQVWRIKKYICMVTEESRLYLERTNVIFDNFSPLCLVRRRRMMLRNPLGVTIIYMQSVRVTNHHPTHLLLPPAVLTSN